MAELSTKQRERLRKRDFAYVDREGGGTPPDPRRGARTQRPGTLEPDPLPAYRCEGGGAQENPPRGEEVQDRGVRRRRGYEGTLTLYPCMGTSWWRWAAPGLSNSPID